MIITRNKNFSKPFYNKWRSADPQKDTVNNLIDEFTSLNWFKDSYWIYIKLFTEKKQNEDDIVGYFFCKGFAFYGAMTVRKLVDDKKPSFSLLRLLLDIKKDQKGKSRSLQKVDPTEIDKDIKTIKDSKSIKIISNFATTQYAHLTNQEPDKVILKTLNDAINLVDEIGKKYISLVQGWKIDQWNDIEKYETEFISNNIKRNINLNTARE